MALRTATCPCRVAQPLAVARFYSFPIRPGHAFGCISNIWGRHPACRNRCLCRLHSSSTCRERRGILIFHRSSTRGDVGCLMLTYVSDFWPGAVATAFSISMCTVRTEPDGCMMWDSFDSPALVREKRGGRSVKHRWFQHVQFLWVSVMSFSQRHVSPLFPLLCCMFVVLLVFSVTRKFSIFLARRCEGLSKLSTSW